MTNFLTKILILRKIKIFNFRILVHKIVIRRSLKLHLISSPDYSSSQEKDKFVQSWKGELTQFYILCKKNPLCHLEFLEHFCNFASKKSVKIPMFVQVLIFLVILLRIALLIGLCCGVLLAEPACLGWLARKLYFDGTASNPAFIHVGRWPGSAQKLLDFFLWHL